MLGEPERVVCEWRRGGSVRCSLEEDELVDLGFLRLGCPGVVGDERLFAESPGSGAGASLL